MSPSAKVNLTLEDGTVMEGISFGANVPAAGEVVFNTAMTGYPESLTDASYKGQILVATYPLIGNYGVPEYETENGLLRHFESDKVQVSGLIVADYSVEFSHWNAAKSLSDWLKEHHIPGIYGIDTRSLTKRLREKGTMLGKITPAGTDGLDFYDPNLDNLVGLVSPQKRQVFGHGRFKVLLLDCGVKYNIIRCLLTRDTTVIRVPWDYDIIKDDYDGLFISNGPGDPKMCVPAIKSIQKAFEIGKPIFGICSPHKTMAMPLTINLLAVSGSPTSPT
jgi:carbamoyl-phosphate synthase small subunit